MGAARKQNLAAKSPTSSSKSPGAAKPGKVSKVGPAPIAVVATAAVVATGIDVSVPGAALVKAAQRLRHVVDHKSTMPIIGYALVRSADDGVLIAGTDLETWAIVDVEAEATVTGDIAVNARRLLDVSRVLPAGAVRVAQTDKGCHLVAGRTTARLEALPGRDFPALPALAKVEWVETDGKALREMISQVEFAVCQDATRFHICSVLVECDGTTTTMVATDGHRLVKARRALAGTALRGAGVLVRHKTARLVNALFTDAPCQVAYAKDRVYFRQGDLTLIGKTVDARFPSYEQVIPKDPVSLVVVDREALIETLKRCKTVASDARGVELRACFGHKGTGAFRVSADNPDLGELVDEIDAEYSGEPEPLGINPQYLIETLARVDGGRVVLSIGSPLDPIMARSIEDATQRPVMDAEFLAVVMPMRI